MADDLIPPGMPEEWLNVGTTPTNKQLREMVKGQEKPTGDYGPPPTTPPTQRELANAKRAAYRAIAAAIPDDPAQPPPEPRKTAREAMEEMLAQEAEDAARAKRNAIWAATDAAKKIAPGEAAEIQKYGAIVDSSVPIEEIQKQLPTIRRLAAEGNFDWAAKAAESPVLAKYIGDPLKASQIASDSSTLSNLEAAITGRFEKIPITLKNPETGEEFNDFQIKWTPPAFIERLRDTLAALPTQMEIGQRHMLAATGITTLTPEQKARDTEVLHTLARQLNKDYAGAYRGEGWKLAIDATMMAAEAVPIIAAGAAGAAVGNVPGAIAMTAAYLAPLKFPEHEAFTKDPQTALATSVIGSTLEASLFTKGFGGQIGLYSKGMEAMFPELMGKVLDRITLTGLMGKGLQTFTHEMISGAVTMTTAGLLDRAVKNIGRLQATGEPIDPNMLDGLVEEFFTNLRGMPVLAAWGTHAKMMHDVGLMNKSYANKKWIDAWANGALGSKILATNKKLFEQLTREMGVQPGAATHLYLDAEKFQEFCIKSNLDPYKVLGEVMGDQRGNDIWDSVIQQGSKDVAIPIEKAYRLVQAKEFLQFVRDEGRFHPDALPASVLKGMADLFHEAIVNPPGPQNEGEAAIHADLSERIGLAMTEANKERAPADGTVFDPKVAANDAANVLLEMIKHVHSRLPGTTLQEVADLLWGSVGFWSGQHQVKTGLVLYKREIGRRIFLDKDGKLRPVSVKDLVQGNIRRGANFDKVKPEDVNSGVVPANELVSAPEVLTQPSPNAGAWWDWFRREMVLFDATGPGQGAANLIHETGHGFAGMLALLAKNFPNEFGKDYDALAQAMGYKDGNDRMLNRDSVKEERLSIWFEEFFRRGKAPTPQLVEAFNQFGYWIRQFYNLGGQPFDPLDPFHGRHHSPARYWESYANQIERGRGGSKVWTVGEWGDLPTTILSRFLGAEEALAGFRAKLDLVDKRVIEQLKKEGKLDENGNPVFGKEESIGSAAQTARELLLEAIDASERKFAKKEKARFAEGFLSELKGDWYISRDPAIRMQRVQAWLKDGETWGPWQQGLKEALTDPETGKPLKLLYSEVERLLGPESARRMSRKGMTTRDPLASIAAEDLQNMLKADGLGEGGQIREWLLDLSTTETLKEYLDRKSNDAVYRQYGYELLDDPHELHRAALDAAMNEKELGKRLVLLRAITQGLSPDRLQRAQLTKGQWEQIALKMMEKKTLREIAPERYYNSMIAADQRALKAMEEGNNNAAFDAIQHAIMNHYLYKEAKKIDTKMESAYEKIVNKVADDRWRSVLGFADPAYRDVTDAILVSLGLAEPQSEAWAQVNPETYIDALIAKVAENGQDSRMVGWDVNIVRELVNHQIAWSDLTPEEARHVYNALLNIHKLASEMNDVRLNDQRMRIVDMQEQMEVALHEAGLGQVFEAKDTSVVNGKMDAFMKGVVGLRTNLMEPRTWLRFLGKDVRDAILTSFIRARDYKVELLKDVMGEFTASFESYKGKDEMFGVTRGISDMLPIEGQRGEVSKRWLMQVMLWMGSETSRAKLLKYTKWTPEMVFKAAGEFLTKDDLAWIQKQHDISDRKLKPLIAAEHERRYGLPFEEVTAMPYEITLKNGEVVQMEGGYYPVRYDRKRSRLSMIKGEEDIDSGGLNDLYPKVSDAYMEKRTGYVDKPDLNWNGYPAHLQRVVHDLAFGEWVHETAKFFLNKRTNNIIRERLGDAVADQPKAWLQAVAFDGNLNTFRLTDGVQEALLRGRGILASAALGHNIALFAGDVFNPFAVGAIQNRGIGFNLTYTVPAYAKTVASWALGLAPGSRNEHYEWAKETFSEVRHRADTTVDQYRQFAGMITHPPPGRAGSILQKVSATNMFFLKHSDAMTATVIATARYYAERAHGKSYEEAVRIANEAVADSMPTHNPLEMPALLRDKNGLGAAVIFYGYWNKLYQMVESRRAEDVMAGQGRDPMKIAELAGSTMAMLVFAEVMGTYFMGHGKDNDEDWGTWFTRRTLGAPMRMYPLLPNLTQPLIDRAVKPRASRQKISIGELPTLAPFSHIANNVDTIFNRRKTTTERSFAVIETALEGQGFFTGYPLPVQAWSRAGKYGVGLMTGDEHPRGIGDVLSGFAFGHSRKHQAETPMTTIDTATKGGHP